jgi:peptidoglycan/LPS O-acetylase OafA/YrhL
MYITKLTSLRGVACLVVLTGHCSDMFNATPGFDDVVGVFGAGGFWPTVHQLILIAVNGQAAVSLFFAMSGYVLCLQLEKIEATASRPLIEFWWRRIFRIYPAAIAGVFFAFAAFSYTTSVPELRSLPLNGYLDQHSGPTDILMNAAVISNLVDPPQWSLKVEIELSAIFPLIFMLAQRLGLFILAITVSIGILFIEVLGHTPLRLAVLPFVLGCALWRFQSLKRSFGRFEGILAGAALCALMVTRRLIEPMGLNPGLFALPESLAVFVLLRAVIHQRLTLSFLDWRPLVTAGEWSYSIYVFHYPIMWAITAAVSYTVGLGVADRYPITAGLALAMLTLAATLPVAFLSYSYIERPFTRLRLPKLLQPKTS